MTAMNSCRHRGEAVFLVALLVCTLAGCSGQKDAAQSLVMGIAAAVSAAQPEAAKYVPERLEDVQAKLKGLQASLDVKDYAAVVAAAPQVLVAAQSLATEAATKKDQILKDENDSWTNLAAALSEQVTTLQARVVLLDKKAKTTAQSVNEAAAQASMADITSRWSKAQAAFASGNLEEAVATAQEVKSEADALVVTLQKMPGSLH